MAASTAPSMALARIAERLAGLDSDHARRTRRTLQSPCGPKAVVDGRELISFCSNDYLGLANHPSLIEAAREGASRYGVGAGASHLVSGHSEAHEALEHALARFMGQPRALLFSTGYMANMGIVPALVGRHDAVFSDKLNHACLTDAALLSRASLTRYPHNDVAALARALAASTAEIKLVITDGVFSMDGDLAPLPDILALCRQHDALLLVDDAHGFGVIGPGGRGTMAHFGLDDERVLTMGTLGKAAGVAGAFVTGHATLIDWLMQRARTYIFTTALPPLLSHTLLTALGLIASGDDRRARLQAHIAALKAGLAHTRWPLMPSDTAIQPLLVGDNAPTLALAAELMHRGLWVPAIRPPTVPPGQARLRISLSAAHGDEDVARLIETLRHLS